MYTALSTKSSSNIQFLLCFVGVIATISVFCSLCIQLYRRVNHGHARERAVSVPEGVILATLLKYPKIQYSRVRLEKGKSGISSPSACSICLGDYRPSDLLRLLPDCGHFYHVKCIDPWLRAHWSCPICRNSTIPASRVRARI